MKYAIITILLIANQVFAQSEKTTELKTSISDVTVYLNGAQITRQGETKIESGRSKIIVKSLSPFVNQNSIQVKATGPFTILSVNRTFNYLNELALNAKTDSLNQLIHKIEQKIGVLKSRLEVLAEMQSLLNVNKKLGGETSGTSVAELKQAIDFYNAELTKIKQEERSIKNDMDELNKELVKLRNQVANLQNNQDQPTSEIVINVEANAKTSGNFMLSYQVANAGWYPQYDLRVKDVQSPLQLTYKAAVYQNTGVDWDNVKLKFSNANPNQSGVAPELTTWYLNFYRNTLYRKAAYGMNATAIGNVSGRVFDEGNNPLTGVNVVATGTTIGTVTDTQGNFAITLPRGATHLSFSYIGYASQDVPITGSHMNVSLMPDIMQLEEMVVTGYGSKRKRSEESEMSMDMVKEAAYIETTVVENQTTVEFTVDRPYTIKSNGETLSVNLNELQIETKYEYRAVPKLDKDAFLMARIINWDQYNLLEGEANLYFEDAYVGRSILNTTAITDTLDISLGRDRNIVITREKIDTYSKKQILGSNKIESRGFNISIRNKKQQPIHMTIYDQIPVSANGEIEVTANDISGGQLDKQTGFVTWTMDLPPQGQKELKLQYEVKYPKKEKLMLE